MNNEGIHYQGKGLEFYVLPYRDRKIILDVKRSRVFEVDPLFPHVLRVVDKPTKLERLKIRCSFPSYLEQIMKEIQALRAQGYFVSSQSAGEDIPIDKCRMTLCVVHGCNMRCHYCQSYRNRTHISPQLMDFLTAKQALDFFIKEYAPKGEKFTLSFTSDGETLYNFHLVEKIKTYSRELEIRHRNRFSFERFSFATNATLFTDEILGKVCQDDLTLFFSVDGPPEIHNHLRPMANGAGSYERMLPWLQRYRDYAIKQGKFKFTASTVLTSYYTDFSEILRHLINLGFEHATLRPIRSNQSHKYALNEGTLPDFKDGFTNLAASLEEKVKFGQDHYLRMLLDYYDFFGKIFTGLLLESRRVYGCPGSISGAQRWYEHSITVDINGDIYFPCRDFIGLPEFMIGNVFSGIHKDKLSQFKNLMVDNRPICHECWARYLCGGGCYKMAYFANGEISKPHPILCELIRHVVKLNMKLFIELEKERPDFITDMRQQLERLKRGDPQGALYRRWPNKLSNCTNI